MTPNETFDVIVIGARCAGSSTAMLLARQGHRVLILDRDDFPSDMKASTHMMWQGGAGILHRWGLLGRLRETGCTPMSIGHLDLGDFVLTGKAPPADGVTEAYAPRRFVLDNLLLDAAREAGAEFRPRCAFDDVLIEDDVVVGVTYRGPDGQATEARASIVVGADGRHSKVARAVDATLIEEHPRLQGTVWAYFKNLSIDDMEFYSRPGRMVYAWYTHDDETLAGICFRYEDYLGIAKNAEESMPAELEALAPEFAARVASAERTTPWLAGATRGFRREAVGPGWALVGDAGLTMDPITAAGITNALRDGEFLAEAIHAGLSGARPMDEALSDFQAKRDAASNDLFAFTREMAKLDPPDQLMIDLFTSLHGNQADTDAYFGIFAQTVSVAEFFAPENVERIIAAAAEAKQPMA